MSIYEAGVRVLVIALAAGIINYVYGHFYSQFVLSRTESPTKQGRFFLRLLAVPPALLFVVALFFPTWDKPLFKLICENALLFFGTPIIIILFSVPGLLKMTAAGKLLSAADKPPVPELSRFQANAMITVLYVVVAYVWLDSGQASSTPDIVLMLIVATGITVLRFIGMPKIAARMDAGVKARALRVATHLFIVSWLFAANTIYRAI